MNDVAVIESSMVAAARDAGATVINSTFHHFSPYGVSGVVVIQESHLAIHTWPEYGYAAVDLFTCGDEVDPWISFDLLKKAFEAKNSSALELHRGNVNMLERVEFNIDAMRDEAEERVHKAEFKRNLWFTDRDANQALSLRYEKVLYSEQSPYQKVKIIDTYGYGKTLTLDNMVMCTEVDEYHYHEMISHPAMLTHGNVKNVLVIGGGDGGTVREVLRHTSVEKVTMVEIDALVIEASRKYLPSISCALDDPKLDLIVGDGIHFVAEAAAELYDLVIVDGSDPVGPAEGLFSDEFYKNCHKVLKQDGILVTQGESPKFNQSAFCGINSTMKKHFGKEKVFAMLFYATTYPTGMWSFQLASKTAWHPVNNLDAAAADAFTSKHELHYYNEGIHRNAFALPNFVKTLLNE